MALHRALEHLRQRLTSEGAKTVEFFAALPPEAWDHPVYTTGPRWRVRHVLAHFVSAERGYLHYMRDSVAGGSGVPRDFDIDAFNATQVAALSDRSPAQLLEALRAVRQETCEFVATLRPEDLDRVGYHPWFGDETLSFLIRLIYRHPMLHLRDVRLALETGAAVPDGEGASSFARGPSANGGQ
jgi:uncharacterized protein (TIGR03083 family)